MEGVGGCDLVLRVSGSGLDLQGGVVEGLGGRFGADEGTLGPQLHHTPLRVCPRALQYGDSGLLGVRMSSHGLRLLLHTSRLSRLVSTPPSDLRGDLHDLFLALTLRTPQFDPGVRASAK